MLADRDAAIGVEQVERALGRRLRVGRAGGMGAGEAGITNTQRSSPIACAAGLSAQK
ncbi:MAG: hypothetical protein V4574_22065 [Pseudomonadota bacterium]